MSRLSQVTAGSSLKLRGIVLRKLFACLTGVDKVSGNDMTGLSIREGEDEEK